jgi:hypothetical protein
MKSIMNNEKVCVVCGDTVVHRHHIFYGTGNRKQSERYGCWVYLCPLHHNMSLSGVHFDTELDMKLKKECQEKWEEIYGTREEFIKTFGRNYLWEE